MYINIYINSILKVRGKFIVAGKDMVGNCSI